MDPYIGDIRLFGGSFAPRGWVLCAGQLMSISQFSAVFAVIGTTYGGDGVTTFAVPDLRGRIPVGQGTGPGLTPRVLGQQFGSETVTLLSTQIPSHTHNLEASTATAGEETPTNGVFAQNGTDKFYVSAASGAEQLNPATIQLDGGSLPHDNIMPTTAINYIMCVEGIFPSRN